MEARTNRKITRSNTNKREKDGECHILDCNDKKKQTERQTRESMRHDRAIADRRADDSRLTRIDPSCRSVACGSFRYTYHAWKERKEEEKADKDAARLPVQHNNHTNKGGWIVYRAESFKEDTWRRIRIMLIAPARSLACSWPSRVTP